MQNFAEFVIMAVSGYFGNGARAFEIGKNNVVLDRIGKNLKNLKNQYYHLHSGIYLKNGLDGPIHQVQKTLGPGQHPGRGFRGAKPP